MFYLFAALFFILVFYVVSRVLKSIVKGCLTIVFLLVVTAITVILVQSTKEPVTLFNLIEVNNLEVTRKSE